MQKRINAYQVRMHRSVLIGQVLETGPLSFIFREFFDRIMAGLAQQYGIRMLPNYRIIPVKVIWE